MNIKFEYVALITPNNTKCFEQTFQINFYKSISIWYKLRQIRLLRNSSPVKHPKTHTMRSKLIPKKNLTYLQTIMPSLIYLKNNLSLTNTICPLSLDTPGPRLRPNCPRTPRAKRPSGSSLRFADAETEASEYSGAECPELSKKDASCSDPWIPLVWYPGWWNWEI